MITALAGAEKHPAYLHYQEPYSGVFLNDLGIGKEVAFVARWVYCTLKTTGAKTDGITDSHTTFRLWEIYPRLIFGFDLEVRFYLQVLAQSAFPVKISPAADLPEKILCYDSCVITCDWVIFPSVRTVLSRLRIEVVDPVNCDNNMVCCGGPIEYAFADLSLSVLCIRARELASEPPISSLLTRFVCLNLLSTNVF